jgi:hypothetical protein
MSSETENPRVTPKVCILGLHHAYQFKILRPAYLKIVLDLIQEHSVDLVAEESSDTVTTYIQELIASEKHPGVAWKNVDLNAAERALLPDANPDGWGTLLDYEFQMSREKAWVERTLATARESALLICGAVHALSVAGKFKQAGANVEIHLFLPREDEPQ